MTSTLGRVCSALGLGALVFLTACGMEEPGDEAVTSSEKAAVTADAPTCYGRFFEGNAKMCYLTTAEKLQAAERHCQNVSNYYGETLVVSNVNDSVLCRISFDCCTPQ